MEAKTIRPKARAIQDRFFQALDILIESGRLKSLQSFCIEHDLHRPKYSRLRSASHKEDNTACENIKIYKFIDIDALAYLASDFGVSCEWILLGKGSMFK